VINRNNEESNMEIMGVQLELWVALLGAVLALAVWGLKQYKKVMADGKVTIDEVIDTLTGVEAQVDDVVEKTEAVRSAMKKAELIALCKEAGLPTTGTKADLLARLAEAEVE